MACAVYALLTWLYGSLGRPAFVVGSYLTMLFRRPVPPAKVLDAFHVLIWLLRWLVVPALIGSHGSPHCCRGVARLSIVAPEQASALLDSSLPVVAGAIWLPVKLLAWIPGMPNFGAEMASFLIRLVVAYLLFAGVLLALEWRTAGGRPLLSQPRTSSTP